MPSTTLDRSEFDSIPDALEAFGMSCLLAPLYHGTTATICFD